MRTIFSVGGSGIKKLVLVEGLPKYEGVHEAEALTDALELMKRAFNEKRRKSLVIESHAAEDKTDFLNWLERKCDFLHISSHGEIGKDGKSVLNITRGGKVTAKDIQDLDVKAEVVFLNACQTSRNDMADAFFRASRRRKMYFISTRARVPFDEAFLVALLFYKKAFVERRSSIPWALRYTNSLKDIRSEYWFWPKK
jgi:hypothetical protein